MKLTKENKDYIDALSYEQLLSHWRFAPIGDPWFQGKTGKYWKERLSTLRNEDKDRHVKTSKEIGWTKSNAHD